MENHKRPPTGREVLSDKEPVAANSPEPKSSGSQPDLKHHTSLENAESRLAGIMEAAMDAIITVDTGQQIVFFNSAAEKMFSCSAEEALGQSIDRFIPQRYRTDHSKHFDSLSENAASARNKAGSREIRGLRADGTEFPAEASISHVNAGGNSLYTVIMRDITSRVEARDELEKQGMILDLAPVLILDPDFHIVRWSSGAERMFGWKEEEVIGKITYELFKTKTPTPRPQILEEFFRTGRWSGSLTVQHKDGREIVTESRWALHRSADGSPSAILAIHDDVTEREIAERALIQSEKRYRNLFADNPHPMWVFAVDTLAFLEVNQSAMALYGYSREEFLSMTIKEIRPEEDVDRLIETTSAITDHPTGKEIWRHKRKDGSLIDVEISAHPLEFAGKRARLVLAYDITDRAMLEEQLRQSQKMEAIGMLAGGVAHDFNNLLTAINGYTELSLMKVSSGDPIRRNLLEVARAGERAALLTQQLLAFSRKQVMQPKTLDLNLVIGELEKMLHRLIGEHIILESKLADRLWLTKADPGQIDQIIMNLAINARDAMGPGGHLTIETRNVELDENYAASHLDVSPGEFVMLAISDTGTGMTPEVRDRVFDPFYTTKESGKGTGLGLSTVYGIVKQSGGTIWVYSEPGHGSTFKIYFPRAVEATEAYRRSDAGSDVPHGVETIIVAEDADQVRDVTCGVLRLYGYNVLEAGSAGEALELCERNRGKIDLLLTDVVMPEVGGGELAERIQNNCPKLKVLYMSGYTDDTIIQRGVLNAAANFVQKPFTAEGLARKVREVLDAPPRSES